MSIVYPVKKISVTAVIALDDLRVSVGSVWQTGNLLFRSRECGADLQLKIENRARCGFERPLVWLSSRWIDTTTSRYRQSNPDLGYLGG